MSVRLHALDAMAELPAGRMDAVVGWLGDAARDIVPRLMADRVDVVVAPSRHLIPGWDCNGFANGPGRITIGISTEPIGEEIRVRPPGDQTRRPDPDRRDLAGQLRAVLAHELHHVMRTRGPGYGRSLGEALVSEGLAQCFEEEVGCPTPNYATAVGGELLGLAAMRARSDWSSSQYDHGRWFFGDRTDPTYPWSGGYSLGYALVRHFLAASGMPASAAAGIPAEQVREIVGEELDRLAEHAQAAT